MPHPLITFSAKIARLLPESFKQRLYNLGPITEMIRGVLNRVAPQDMAVMTIAAGELAGLKMAINMLKKKDYWLGTYEVDLQTTLAAYVRPGMVAYDVGANLGYISLLLGRLAGPSGQVFAFEPLPDNIEILKQNFSLNPGLAAIQIVPQAVSGQTGPVEFLVHASDNMGKVVGSAGRQEQYQETISLSAVTLDDFVYDQGQPPPDILKIDIEGGEVLAFGGMPRVLAEARPIVLIELHGPESAQAAWQALTAANYTLYSMGADKTPVQQVEDLDWKAYLLGLPNE